MITFSLVLYFPLLHFTCRFLILHFPVIDVRSFGPPFPDLHFQSTPKFQQLRITAKQCITLAHLSLLYGLLLIHELHEQRKI